MDTSIIYGFYKLPSKIRLAKQRIKYFECDFWKQSFIDCPLAFDDNGNKLNAKPFYKQVDKLIDDEIFNRNVADLLVFKWQQFNRYLNTLDDEERKYLNAKYLNKKSIPVNARLDQQTINECYQIEEASGYRYGYMNEQAVDMPIDIDDDYKSNFNKMLALFS